MDYHSETFLLLCLPLHSSYFLESPPTVISLNMKTAYFCLIVLLICKIPASSESEDDCCECMESTMRRNGSNDSLTIHTNQPHVIVQASPCTREGKHYCKGIIKACSVKGQTCYGSQDRWPAGLDRLILGCQMGAGNRTRLGRKELKI